MDIQNVNLEQIHQYRVAKPSGHTWERFWLLIDGFGVLWHWKPPKRFCFLHYRIWILWNRQPPWTSLCSVFCQNWYVPTYISFWTLNAIWSRSTTNCIWFNTLQVVRGHQNIHISLRSAFRHADNMELFLLGKNITDMSTTHTPTQLWL